MFIKYYTSNGIAFLGTMDIVRLYTSKTHTHLQQEATQKYKI